MEGIEARVPFARSKSFIGAMSRRERQTQLTGSAFAVLVIEVGLETAYQIAAWKRVSTAEASRRRHFDQQPSAFLTLGVRTKGIIRCERACDVHNFPCFRLRALWLLGALTPVMRILARR